YGAGGFRIEKGGDRFDTVLVGDLGDIGGWIDAENRRSVIAEHLQQNADIAADVDDEILFLKREQPNGGLGEFIPVVASGLGRRRFVGIVVAVQDVGRDH